MQAIFVMLKTDPGHMTAVANTIAGLETFSEVYSITGPYDLLVKLYVEKTEAVGRLIEQQIHTIPHIRETYTILTFEAFGVGGNR